MPDTEALVAAGLRRQIERFHQAIADGQPRIGWKIAAADAAARERIGISDPLLGWLHGWRIVPAGETYRPPEGSKPRIEAELAVRVGTAVPGGATQAEAAAAIVDVAPAFEFVDAARPSSPLDEMLANNVVHEAVMFGAVGPLSLSRGIGAAGFPKVTVNGELRAEGHSDRVPDDLSESVLFAANTLAGLGEVLLAGDRIICGTYIDPFEVAPGDQIQADFGPLGSLSVSIAG